MARFMTFQRFLGCSQGSDRAVRRAAFCGAHPPSRSQGPCWRGSSTTPGSLQQGAHSVFAERRDSGTAGEVCHGQVAASMSSATEAPSMPLGYDPSMPAS